MRPVLPGQVHPRLSGSRTDHFQRLHSLRQLRVCLPAAREGGYQRRRPDPGADRLRKTGRRKRRLVVHRLF